MNMSSAVKRFVSVFFLQKTDMKQLTDLDYFFYIPGAHSQSGRNRLPNYANSQKIGLTIRGSLQVKSFQKNSFVQNFIEKKICKFFVFQFLDKRRTVDRGLVSKYHFSFKKFSSFFFLNENHISRIKVFMK